jgi:hypothetical protein
VPARLTPQERAWREWPESAVQAAVRDAAARGGWAYDHARTSMVKTRHGLVGDSHQRGRPDTTLARPGELVIVECKRELGKVSPEQMAWLNLYASIAGVRAFIVRPSNLDAVVDLLLMTTTNGRAPDLLIPGRQRRSTRGPSVASQRAAFQARRQ